MPYYHPNGTLLEEPIVGIGRTGLVLPYHGHVVKIAQAYRNPCASSEEKEIEDIVIEQNCAFLENEKDVYRRLGDHEGIINIIAISDQGIEMAYMDNGSLFHYLQAQEPRLQVAVSWILKLAETVCYVHSRFIVIADLTSRNVLLDKEMSLRLCDFSDAGVMPPCTDMSKAQHYGLSVKTDIFQFGSLMYEILTRKSFSYDLLANKYVEAQRLESGDEDWQASAIWPRPEDLPKTDQFYLGYIVLRCWTGLYQHMGEVCEAIKTASSRHVG